MNALAGLRPTVSRARITAIAATLLATSCSAGLASGAGDTALTPPVVSASAAAPVTGYDGLMGLPLSAYGTSEQDDDLLFRAERAVVVRCMRSRGHQDYSGQNMVRSSLEDEEDREAVRPAGAWGYIGRATARNQGFHPRTLPMGASTGMTAEAGKDFEACSAEAGEQLPDLTGTDGWKLTQSLFGQSFQQAAADRRVTAARKRWSACMTEAGHPAEDPEKLAEGSWKTARPTDDEIAAATAAESCTRSSGLAAVFFAVLTGYQRQMVPANTDALTAYQKQVQKQIGRATHLLADFPAT
ncbi:hypothetical protein ACIRYZ_37515 [Kitasatospora sp. NPDC101155]|uniref:hypothetical protein n=1 Tax=Kitasatospora sp. NPDC101155 TaxID=3364097 RepID=UPI00381A9684